MEFGVFVQGHVPRRRTAADPDFEHKALMGDIEIVKAADKAGYVTGFLVTTAGLHVVGATAGLIVLEQARGRTWLRLAGAATAMTGVVLTVRTIGMP